MAKLAALLARGGATPPLAVRHVVLRAEPTNALLAAQAGAEPRPEKNAGVVLAWPGSEAERDAAERALAPHAALVLRADEIVHWDELGAPGADTVVLVYAVRRRAGLSFEAFASHYRERHAPLARAHHPGIARYVQNFRDAAEEDAGIDAVSELWFADERDARERFYRDEASRRAIAEDVRRFADLRAGAAFAARPVA